MERSRQKMSFFKRLKTFVKSEMPAKETSLKEMQKQVDASIRELKVKIETLEAHLLRTEQEIIEKDQLADKYRRYAEKASDETDKSNFKLQEQKAQKEKIDLQQTKQQITEGLTNLQQVYDKMEQDYQDTITRIKTLEVELNSKQLEGDLRASLASLEEETTRKLYEAEALLELRKDPY